MQAKGYTWKDFAVAGGGGDSAMTVLKSRVVSGNAPAAAQIKGPSLQEWAKEGVLASIDDVAKAEKRDDSLPKVVAEVMKYKGNYIAAPVNVHRVNWLWANAEVLRKANAKLPTTWDEFFATAEALKKAGVIPVAHGGQGWQYFTTFEAVALGVWRVAQHLPHRTGQPSRWHRDGRARQRLCVAGRAALEQLLWREQLYPGSVRRMS